MLFIEIARVRTGMAVVGVGGAKQDLVLEIEIPLTPASGGAR